MGGTAARARVQAEAHNPPHVAWLPRTSKPPLFLPCASRVQVEAILRHGSDHDKLKWGRGGGREGGQEGGRGTAGLARAHQVQSARLLGNAPRTQRPTPRFLFRMHDLDGSGKLVREEVHHMLQARGCWGWWLRVLHRGEGHHMLQARGCWGWCLRVLHRGEGTICCRRGAAGAGVSGKLAQGPELTALPGPGVGQCTHGKGVLHTPQARGGGHWVQVSAHAPAPCTPQACLKVSRIKTDPREVEELAGAMFEVGRLEPRWGLGVGEWSAGRGARRDR